jgi:hypothetical protein
VSWCVKFPSFWDLLTMPMPISQRCTNRRSGRCIADIASEMLGTVAACHGTTSLV